MLKFKIFVGSLVGATALSAMVLSSSTASAETYSKSALIRVQAACTMDGIVSTPHTDTIANGTYRSEIGETVISAVCNDGGGFGVYAIGFTNDVDGNNVMKHDTDDTFNIATGIATSGNTSNWAMKLAAVENGTDTPTIENGFSSYKAVPSNYTLVASYPNATTTGSNVAFLTHYAAYISLAQHSGVYTGKVKYVMVHPSTGPAPQKECLDFECAAGDLPDYPDPSDLTKRYHAMQDIQNICPKVKTPTTADATPPSIGLIDLRDNKIYHVAKLVDGRCWMQDSLALDLTDSDVQTAMTTHDYTNASATTLGYLFNGGGTAESKYASVAVAEYPETWSNTFSVPNLYKGAAGTVPNEAISIANDWKAGIYYNACAAFAGGYCYTDEYNGAGNPPEVNSEQNPCSPSGDCDRLDILEDICPSGWRLPTGGIYYSDGSSYVDMTLHMSEFERIYYAYRPNMTDYRAAMHFALPGSYYAFGNLYEPGKHERFWTSTAGRSKSVVFSWAYNHSASTDDAYRQEHDRYYALAIRCISK